MSHTITIANSIKNQTACFYGRSLIGYDRYLFSNIADNRDVRTERIKAFCEVFVATAN